MKVAIKKGNVITGFNKIPESWNGVLNYNSVNNTEQQFEDGWREIKQTSFDDSTHKQTNQFEEVFENDVLLHFIYKVVALTQDELDQKVISDKHMEKQAITEKYEWHKQNGWLAYQDFRADIVLSINNGVLTELDAFKIEAFLKIGFDKVSNSGDWKTAHYVLNQIDTEDILLKEYKNKALLIISTYIQTNYD